MLTNNEKKIIKKLSILKNKNEIINYLKDNHEAQILCGLKKTRLKTRFILPTEVLKSFNTNHIYFNLDNLKNNYFPNMDIEKSIFKLNYFFANIYFPKITNILNNKNETIIEKQKNDFILYKTEQYIDFKNIKNVGELLLESYIEEDFKKSEKIHTIEGDLEDFVYKEFDNIFNFKDNNINNIHFNNIYRTIFRYIYSLRIKDLFYQYQNKKEINIFKELQNKILKEKKINLLKLKMENVLSQIITKNIFTIHIVNNYSYIKLDHKDINQYSDIDFCKLFIEDLFDKFQESEINLIFEEKNIIKYKNKQVNKISGINAFGLELSICKEQKLKNLINKELNTKYKYSEFNFHL
jgi:hypothetical protein